VGLPNPNRHSISENRKKDEAVSSQAVARSEERNKREHTLNEHGKGTNVSEERSKGTNVPKDNWLGFIGDVSKFTGQVRFKSMLRIDGNFAGQVDSSDGTLIVSNGAQVTQAVINVAVAKINGTVEGDINASKELVLGRTASVTGNVTSPALVVEEGAMLNGICRRT
jgi:cytoskeletal protein CcmA (bactofilin family)